ncbi:hypothetical protein RAZWK3B_16490 [Roseobacter sp. AzwK-3b]|nr:hypothetical protein RAZWK3B_16490 [Roseobacter sp. AzwK-3b]
MYRKEGAEQAAICGYEIALSPGRTKGRFGWHVEARIDGAEVQADVEVLVWSDIVRGSMAQGVLATYGQLLQTAWVYIASGALFPLIGLRKGPFLAVLYPVGFLLLQLVLAVLAAFGLGSVLGLIHPWLAWGGLIALPVVLEWFRRNDNRFLVYYLMHDYAYSARYRGANPPELEARMAEFGDLIAQALSEDVQEVLVVGHSSGVHLAVSILSDLIRAGRVPANGPALAFLSLGQVVPMVSFLPKASRLRGDLRYLSTRDELTWVDVSAPGDGCAFALCDPVAVTGVAPEGKRWPLVLSAAFRHTLSPERWKLLRRQYFRLHFQYMCAFDYPGDYDYFRITAGPQTLAARYRGRTPSPSRIERPVSRYTGVST